MSVMRTFGRDEKRTPHVHMFMTSGSVDKNTDKKGACDYHPSFFKKTPL